VCALIGHVSESRPSPDKQRQGGSGQIELTEHGCRLGRDARRRVVYPDVGLDVRPTAKQHDRLS
jgi:hypothetical protein